MSHHFSPLRYPGGKASIFPVIESLRRANNLRVTTYVEPYAGGAGVALAMLLMERVDEIIINDFDRAIYAFWKSILTESERFLESLQKVRVCVAEWRRQKETYENKHASLFDLGFATFFLNRTNRSGIMNGGPIGGMDQSGNYKINARFNKKALSERIIAISQYKNRISVKQTDGILLAEKVLPSRDVLVYLDPPYVSQGASLYLNHYQLSDHCALARSLNRRRRSNWLLTYDNSPTVRKLYSARSQREFSLLYKAHEVRMGKEVLILSDAFEFNNIQM